MFDRSKLESLRDVSVTRISDTFSYGFPPNAYSQATPNQIRASQIEVFLHHLDYHCKQIQAVTASSPVFKSLRKLADLRSIVQSLKKAVDIIRIRLVCFLLAFLIIYLSYISIHCHED